MTPEAIIFPILSLVFGAGGAYFLIQQSRKDVNGLGSKVNREAMKAARRHHNVSLSLMLLAPNDKALKQQIAEMLKESQD